MFGTFPQWIHSILYDCFLRFGFLILPCPLQMLHWMYPELPPVLRTRLVVVFVYLAVAIESHLTAPVCDSITTVIGVCFVCFNGIDFLEL